MTETNLSPDQLLYEDADLAVLNKPAGVVVNDAQSVKGETIQAWWTDYLQKSQKQPTNKVENSLNWQSLIPDNFDVTYGSPEEIFTQRGGIVHRLDKETSGCLVLAKNPGALVALLSDFKQRKVKKTYSCLVHGRMAEKSGVIDFPIARHPVVRSRMAVVSSGRASVTRYQLMKEFGGFTEASLVDQPSLRALTDRYQGFSLLECAPETGRMHQIRVHLYHIGHPLVSDYLYAGRKRARNDRLWCQRVFLHATEIQFVHPRTKELLAIKAPLDEELQKVLLLLEPDSTN